MKKLLNLLFACVFAFILTACGGGSDSSAGQTANSPVQSSTSDNGQTSTATSGTASNQSGSASSTTTTPAPVVSTQPTPVAPVSGYTYGSFAKADLGPLANLNGAISMPANSEWNRIITNDEVDPLSATIMGRIGVATGLHADFGAGLYMGMPMGIPYVIVDNTQPLVPISWTDYASESDNGPYPIPKGVLIEGDPGQDGDRHMIIINKDTNKAYETWRTFDNGDGTFRAANGAIMDLSSSDPRPQGRINHWTSADAAGLPIFPGLVRYEEASRGAGGINHAIRFTLASTRTAYVYPATHAAGSNGGTNLPPMGARFRLKASYVIPDSFSKESKAILTAMKTYGMFLADNGSNMYISGSPDPRWNNDLLASELGSVKSANFEVVKMGTIIPQGQ